MDIKDYFRRNRKCIISGVTAAALVAGSCFAGTVLRPVETYSYEQEVILAENDEKEAETEVLTSDTVADELTSKFGVKQKDINKDETVYAFADANGSVNNILVSEWLRNPEKKAELTDKSNLSDIVNVKGDETFTQDGENITWQANGNDIYYQGTIDKKLPVNVKVTYYLDGKETKAEDMGGVSGHVTIRFDYTNETSVEKEVNGKKEKIKIPFIAVSGLILNENFKNVTVNNGRTIPQGTSTIVLGYGLPGVKETLGLDDANLSEDIDLPEYFEVSADVESFSLDMTMTAVVSASEFSFDGGFDTSKLDDMINQIGEAGNSLADGSQKLADGTATLLSKMGEFTTGAKQVASGAGEVKSGADQVAAGASQLKDGLDSLVSGSSTLATGVTVINQSAAGVSQGVTALDTALNTPMTDEQKAAMASQASTAAVQAVDEQFADGTDTYNNVYGQAVDNFKTALTNEDTVSKASNKVSAGLKSNAELRNSLIDAVVIQYYQSTYADAFNTAEAVNIPSYEQYKAALTANGTMALIEAGVDAKLEEVSTTVTTQITSGIADEGAAKVGEGVVAACQSAAGQAAGKAAGDAVVAGAEGAKKQIAGQIEAVGENGYSLVSGTQALAAGTSALNEKVPSLTAGIGLLSNGASQLATGSSQLATGTAQLADGSSKLASGSEQLTEGVKQLSEGADELNQGMNKFNNEAIKKIVDAYNGDIKDIAGKLDAVLEASSEYQTFTAINDGDEGITKFIIKTNGISD